VILASACGSGNSAITAPSPTPIPTPTPTPIPSGLGTVSGVVFEVAPSGRVPVEGALVTGPWDYPVTTDSNGAFSLSVCGDSPCVFHNGDPFVAYISKSGYQTVTKEVTINGDTQLDIQLVRR
jgi:hypothetical protein